MSDAKDTNAAGTLVRAWVKGFDDKQREAVKKVLGAERWTQLEAFEKGASLPDMKSIKAFVEGIDSKQKGQIAGILKPAQLGELFKISAALKSK